MPVGQLPIKPDGMLRVPFIRCSAETALASGPFPREAPLRVTCVVCDRIWQSSGLSGVAAERFHVPLPAWHRPQSRAIIDASFGRAAAFRTQKRTSA